jgi:hypothetical protein
MFSELPEVLSGAAQPGAAQRGSGQQQRGALSEKPTPRGTILLSCLVQECEDFVCLDGTSKALTAAKVVDDGSKASASSGVPLSEPRIKANRAPALSAPSSTRAAASAWRNPARIFKTEAYGCVAHLLLTSSQSHLKLYPPLVLLV